MKDSFEKINIAIRLIRGGPDPYRKKGQAGSLSKITFWMTVLISRAGQGRVRTLVNLYFRKFVMIEPAMILSGMIAFNRLGNPGQSGTGLFAPEIMPDAVTGREK